MAAAVRVTDISTHGGIITGPGIPTVLIGGLPAAVMGDQHTCEISSESPHISVSPFVTGSATVLIGGKQALRTSDVCVCGAMPAVGCVTVMIGG